MGRNYLRVRGEYTDKSLSGTPVTELPPRTRRIPARQLPARGERGTSSAYAENTISEHLHGTRLWNYLCVRGEYVLSQAVEQVILELPLRTRRIHTSTIDVPACCGTTSAYAENTIWALASTRTDRNYLRVRGEYFVRVKIRMKTWELPPRTRRIPADTASKPADAGTTSAYAENTLYSLVCVKFWWNYLRVRGEYKRGGCRLGQSWELPPRTRRIP